MSQLRLEYEVLVSGIYPFQGQLEKGGFKSVWKTLDAKFLDEATEKGTIYISPFIGMCCYPDAKGTPVYLILQKDEVIDIDYPSGKEYDRAITNEHIEKLNVFDAVDTLEKTLVLEVNNDIKFPVKFVRAYDTQGNLVAFCANFMKLNIPGLISNDKERVLEIIKRQNNRLGFGVLYEGITELADNNKYFKNALSMYHTSFSLSDHQAGFMLLMIALEALLALNTYSKPETCESCGQVKYAITATISQNVGLFLMDQDDSIKKRIKKLYSVRSKYVHEGKQIPRQDQQEMQEYVRKVLLMYWCISMKKSTSEHKEIIAEVQSSEYKDDIMYKNFLTALGNVSFEEMRDRILKDTLHAVRDASKEGESV